MKCCGIIKEEDRTDRKKWISPKMHYHRGYVRDCDNSYSTARKGRVTYIYENLNLHIFSGIQRDTKNGTYKIQVVAERAINHFKINIYIAGKDKNPYLSSKQISFWQALPVS